jgi:hypothetical protein
MRIQARKSVRLGDLIVVVFDEAAHFSADPREVSRLAKRVVAQMVRRSRMALSQSAGLPMRRRRAS